MNTNKYKTLVNKALRSAAPYLCRVLGEDDPKEKSELSTDDTCALNENK